MLAHRLNIRAGAIDDPDATLSAAGAVEPLGARGHDGDQAQGRALGDDGRRDGDDGGDCDGGGAEVGGHEVGRCIAIRGECVGEVERGEGTMHGLETDYVGMRGVGVHFGGGGIVGGRMTGREYGRKAC